MRESLSPCMKSRRRQNRPLLLMKHQIIKKHRRSVRTSLGWTFLICGSESSTEPAGGVLCWCKVLATIVIFRSSITFPLSLQPFLYYQRFIITRDLYYISILGEELFRDSWPCQSHKLDCDAPGDPRAHNLRIVYLPLYVRLVLKRSVSTRDTAVAT